MRKVIFQMKILLSILGLLLIQSCETNKTYNLVIVNAKVFDTKKGIVLDNKTILINADTIVDIVKNDESLKGKKIIEAHGKLMTPGIIDTILNWSANPSPDYTDIYTVGGALISKEERKPHICHITVDSPSAAKQKMIDYYAMGIRHIKL